MTWFHGPPCKTWNDRMCSVNYVVGNSESCSPRSCGVDHNSAPVMQSSPDHMTLLYRRFFSNLKRHFSTGIQAGGVACQSISQISNQWQSLTWNLKMMISKRNLLFQGLIFRFHVKFQGCMISSNWSISNWCWILGQKDIGEKGLA